MCICSGQRWLGNNPPNPLRTGWTTGWEPVAIKIVQHGVPAQRELAALQEVRLAMSHAPGPHHVIELLGSYIQPAGTSQMPCMYTVTRQAHVMTSIAPCAVHCRLRVPAPDVLYKAVEICF